MGVSEAAAEWHGLHPASVLVNLVPRTLAFARSAWPLLLALLYGRAEGGGLFDLVFLGTFLLGSIGTTVTHFLTLRYRMRDGVLEIRSGLLYRQNRVIAPARIQNIELTRNLFHRWSGLSEVRIETASGREVEGLLSALSVEHAEALIRALNEARSLVDDATEEQVRPVLVENSVFDLVKYGVTVNRLGAAAVAAGVAFEALQWSEPERIQELGGLLGFLGTLTLIVAVVTGAWLLGVVMAVVRHFGFRLTHAGRSLAAEEGLFTRRAVELPLAKVQVVSVVEPVLRRIAGFGSVHIETAAARVGAGGTQRSEAMAPLVASGALYDVVSAAIPDLDVTLSNAPLKPPHPRALLRTMIGASVRAALAAGFLGWWLWPWGALGVVLVPLGIVLAWLDHRHQGWLVTDAVVVARSGYLTRHTRVVSRNKLQSLEVRQGPFLARYGLGRLVVRVAGDAVALPVLAMDHALALQLELLHGAEDDDEQPNPDAP
jgi:putative membrane protein